MNKLEELLKRLDRIAEANNDEFRYAIEMETGHRDVPVVYAFVATESADGHAFVSGSASTIEMAIEEAQDQIRSACAMWNYKNVP